VVHRDDAVERHLQDGRFAGLALPQSDLVIHQENVCPPHGRRFRMDVKRFRHFRHVLPSSVKVAGKSGSAQAIAKPFDLDEIIRLLEKFLCSW
jgi:hypothetical protein